VFRFFVILVTFICFQSGWLYAGRFFFNQPALLGKTAEETDFIKENMTDSFEGIHIKSYKDKYYLLNYFCGGKNYSSDGIYFFKNKKLCSIKAKEIALSGIFIAPKNNEALILAEGWEKFVGENNILLFHSSTKFSENQTESGEKAIYKNGFFLGENNAPLYPYFYYSNNSWKEVLPVRELFKISENKNQWILEIFSSNKLPKEELQIKKLLDIKASSFLIKKQNNWLIEITGEKLLSVKTPKFTWSKESKQEIRGIYILSFLLPNKKLEETKEIIMKNCTIKYEATNSKIELKIEIRENNITEEEISAITALFNAKIPSIYTKE